VLTYCLNDFEMVPVAPIITGITLVFTFHIRCISIIISSSIMGRVAQSVWRLATGWTVRGSNPGEGEIFRTYPDRPWGPPSLLFNEYRVFPGVECGRGVTLTPRPLLVPCSKTE
jgi:hypothetical protein